MSEVILFTSGKGGVGKTSIVTGVGTSLAAKGKKTVIVDMNQGLRGIDIALGLENQIVYNIFDVLNGRSKISHVLVKVPNREGLSLLPASQVHKQKDVDPVKLKEIILELKKHFDYVLIDGCSGLDLGFENSALYYDKCAIICTGDVLSVRAADKIKEVLRKQCLNSIQVLINRYRPVLVDSGDMISLQEMEDLLGLDTLGIIPEDQEMYITSNNGEILNQQTSEAAKAMDRIAERLTGKDIPIPVFVAPARSRFWKLFRKDNR